jgi:hypothetical protein
MQIGIILPHLGASQLSYLVTQQVNQGGRDYVIFQEHPLPPIQRVRTAILPIYEIAKFKGVLIGTDLSAAKYMVNLTAPSRKLFYPWHVEWMRHGNDYLSTVKTIMSPHLEVIARSQSYAEQIRIMNREPAAIIPDFNLGGFVRYCDEHEKVSRFINEDSIVPGVLREREKYNMHCG